MTEFNVFAMSVALAFGIAMLVVVVKVGSVNAEKKYYRHVVAASAFSLVVIAFFFPLKADIFSTVMALFAVSAQLFVAWESCKRLRQ
jgi:predicted MFS family arabinose efflux permease